MVRRWLAENPGQVGRKIGQDLAALPRDQHHILKTDSVPACPVEPGFNRDQHPGLKPLGRLPGQAWSLVDLEPDAVSQGMAIETKDPLLPEPFPHDLIGPGGRAPRPDRCLAPVLCFEDPGMQRQKCGRRTGTTVRHGESGAASTKPDVDKTGSLACTLRDPATPCGRAELGPDATIRSKDGPDAPLVRQYSSRFAASSRSVTPGRTMGATQAMASSVNANASRTAMISSRSLMARSPEIGD